MSEQEKVGTVGEVAEVKDATEKKSSGREPLDIAGYVLAQCEERGVAKEEIIDADGFLLEVPVTYNERKHKPMKKDDFASEAIFIRWQAEQARQRADFYSAKAVDLDAKATRVEKFGSEAARKAANKLDKAMKQMEKLREQLLATGMDEAELDSIMASM